MKSYWVTDVDTSARSRCRIIAEAGVNHGGDLAAAVRLVEAAARAGADAVKFQTFRASRLATREAPKARYQIENTGDDSAQIDMLRALELGEEDHRALRDACLSHGVEFMSTPFDHESADLLEQIGVDRFKLGSGDLTNHPLLSHVANKGKPLILSTGMSYLGEVEAAVNVARGAGCRDLTLLHCTSNYPAETITCNLRAIRTLHESFSCAVGYSDHTQDPQVACLALALGASVIEKHITLDRDSPGPDHRASLEADDFARWVQAIRFAEAALGDGIKRPVDAELETRRVARRSLTAARDLEEGETLSEKDLCVKRPGTGISPAELEHVIGRSLCRAVRADELIQWEQLA